jgi:hypothetical protein
MVRVSRTFVDETLWPEYQQIQESLRSHLDEVTERVITEVIHADSSEATERSEPLQLTAAGLATMSDERHRTRQDGVL